jgi:hypothetical protein
MRVRTVPLVQGLWRAGLQHGEAVVRPLTGADEATVADLPAGASSAERVTALLAAAVPRIGLVEPLAPAEARRLTVGDRERLLLAVHAVSFGGRLAAVARCPVGGCGALMELDVAVDDVAAVGAPSDVAPGGWTPPAVAADGAPEHELETVVAGQAVRVRFRLPSGADQESVARPGPPDLRAAGDAILRRTIRSVTSLDHLPLDVDDVLDGLRAPLADAFLRLDPLTEMACALVCPECGAPSTASLDAAAFVLGQLAHADSIFLDVDRIARCYHWSETDILALPVARRRRYLGLIAETEALA